MAHKSSIFCLFILSTCVVLLSGRALVAQDQPDPKQILNEHIQKTGGKEAMEKVKSMVSSGKMEIPAFGAEGTVNLYQIPGKFLMEIVIEGIGEVRQGCDGKTVWEVSPQGNRILEGKERATAMENNAKLFPSLGWVDNYDGEIKYLGTENVDDSPAHKLEFVPKDGYTAVRFIDKETGAVVKTETSQENPQMGMVDITVLSSDNRKVDGILVPFKQEFLVDGQSFYMITLEETKFNEPVDDSKFALPAEIKQIMDDGQ